LDFLEILILATILLTI